MKESNWDFLVWIQSAQIHLQPVRAVRCIRVLTASKLYHIRS
jgi:hypothetical protein